MLKIFRVFNFVVWRLQKFFWQQKFPNYGTLISQHRNGTTDITRTFHFGTPTSKQKVLMVNFLLSQYSVHISPASRKPTRGCSRGTSLSPLPSFLTKPLVESPGWYLWYFIDPDFAHLCRFTSWQLCSSLFVAGRPRLSAWYWSWSRSLSQCCWGYSKFDLTTAFVICEFFYTGPQSINRPGAGFEPIQANMVLSNGLNHYKPYPYNT